MNEYRYPGPSVVKELKEVEQRITEIEWEDGVDPTPELDCLYKRRELLRIMKDQGELYVPDF